jgi:hypothetical protein
MTQHKARKIAIRQRMAETGEPYSVARHAVQDEPDAPEDVRDDDWDEAALDQADEADHTDEADHADNVYDADDSEAEARAREQADQARQLAEQARYLAEQARERAERAEEAAEQAEEAAENQSLRSPRTASLLRPSPLRPNQLRTNPTGPTSLSEHRLRRETYSSARASSIWRMSARLVDLADERAPRRSGG